jgi:hypothetical protein
MEAAAAPKDQEPTTNQWRAGARRAGMVQPIKSDVDVMTCEEPKPAGRWAEKRVGGSDPWGHEFARWNGTATKRRGTPPGPGFAYSGNLMADSQRASARCQPCRGGATWAICLNPHSAFWRKRALCYATRAKWFLAASNNSFTKGTMRAKCSSNF